MNKDDQPSSAVVPVRSPVGVYTEKGTAALLENIRMGE